MINKETLIKLFEIMLKIRKFEEKIVELYPAQDMKTPVHLYIGQEAVAAGVCVSLKKTDYVFTHSRSHGPCIAKGTSPGKLLAEFYGKKTGCCKGKGGSMHPADIENAIPGTSAIVGGTIPIAVGTALASLMKKKDNVSVAFFGDGGVDQGTFHEGLNFASLKKLPVIFVCENNFYAVNSPIYARQPHDNIAKRASAYAIPGVEVDGNDVMEIYKSAQTAINSARNGEGPTLIEARTYRWFAHVGPDFDHLKGCRPKEEVESWMKRCPIKKLQEYLFKNSLITEEEIQNIQKKIDDEINSAVKFAKQSPFPEKSECYEDVYFQ